MTVSPFPTDLTDFESGFGTVVFEPNQTTACGQVRLKNDDDPESPEVFMVTFTAANLQIPRRPDVPRPVAEVTIIDDDGKWSQCLSLDHDSTN